MRNVIENLDLLTDARTSTLIPSKSKAVDGEDDTEISKETEEKNDARIEFVGGEADIIDDDDGDDNEAPPLLLPDEAADFHDNELRDILRRTVEIEAAQRPGRHKDAHVQMKQFADYFQHELAESLPSVAYRASTANLAFRERADCVRQHQKAVLKLMRQEQADLENKNDRNEAEEAALHNLLQEEPECTWVPLDVKMQGPAKFAEWLMQKTAEEGCSLNLEQKQAVALLVQPMQSAFLNRPDKSICTIDNSKAIRDVIYVGGGGCGKTTILNKILIPLFRAYFGPRGCILTAPSNKAARLIKGRTIHATQGMTPDNSLRTAALRLSGTRSKLERTMGPAGAKITDEWSQLQASMNHADALRTTYAREQQHKLNRYDYTMPGERFGRMPFVIYSGDHLQLPPVPKSSGLLAPLVGKSKEHKAGASLFANTEYVFQFHTAKRFEDPVLIDILDVMRTPGGKRLPDSHWHALRNTEISAAQSDGRISAAQADGSQNSRQVPGDWYHVCYVWSVTTMAMYMQARMSAKSTQRTLYYIQALDRPVTNLTHLPRNEQKQYYRDFLAEANVRTTKGLPGVCLIHLGMRVRLATNIEPPYAVQDSAGVIVGIEFDESDLQAAAPHANVVQPGETTLRCMPAAVYVKLDDCDFDFLPPVPCCVHSEAKRTCSDCQFFPGVFAVEPLKRKWKFENPSTDSYMFVWRLQLALVPEKAASLYSMQGTTADPGLVAHWVIPKRLSPDIKWLIVYVMLSRGRSLAKLRSVGLSSQIRDIIEAGPPEEVLNNFETLFRTKIQVTEMVAKAAAAELGWC